MNISPEAIKYEILHSAKEWGLHPSTNHRDERFCNEVSKIAIDTLTRPETIENDLHDLYNELRETRLPNDLDRAIQVVLKTHLETARDLELGYAVDSLGMDFEPFFKPPRSGDDTLYRRRREYKRFTQEELDPFQRFTQVTMDAEAYYHKIWTGNRASLEGGVFQAIVAQYMELHLACVNCNLRECLRWNGGHKTLSSWSDVVCLECHATYQIKSKKDADKVDKGLKFNSFRGGSFKRYYKYHPLGKRYLVIVSRAASYDRKQRKMTHNVTIGEIARVLPRLNGESFTKEDKMNITADIELKSDSIQKSWISIPEYEGDFRSIAEEVYTTEFGPGKWNRINSVVDLPGPSRNTQSAREIILRTPFHEELSLEEILFDRYGDDLYF